MSLSDDEDEFLARFLESQVSSEEDEEEREEPEAKRLCIEKDEVNEEEKTKEREQNCKVEIENEDDKNSQDKKVDDHRDKKGSKRIESGVFSKIPPELFPHILKFLSSEDLVSCLLVCKFLNFAASDESLWRRLYCMRWGLTPPTRKLRECAWKKLYIERDEEDMTELVRNCPSEFKEYYIQMQAAKRSQAPLPSQVVDDRIILDKTVLEQVSMWKKSKGLSDKFVAGHVCSGTKCSYHQIDDVFICEETGNFHVCDDNCKEVILDPDSELLVCTISGHCFDRLLLPSDADAEADAEQQQAGMTDEAEPFMGSGRFARAYLLGYNCVDERELERTLRFC